MMGKFSIVVVGVTFEGRQERIERLVVGQKLFWKHDFNNKFDSNAIELFVDTECTESVGHIRAALAEKLIVRRREKECTYQMFVEKVTGGKSNDGMKLHFGLVVTVMTQWPSREEK